MAFHISKYTKQRNAVALVSMLFFCIACVNNTDSLKGKYTHSTNPEAKTSKRKNMGQPGGSAGPESGGSAGSGGGGSAGSGGSGSGSVVPGGGGSVGSGVGDSGRKDEFIKVSIEGNGYDNGNKESKPPPQLHREVLEGKGDYHLENDHIVIEMGGMAEDFNVESSSTTLCRVPITKKDLPLHTKRYSGNTGPKVSKGKESTPPLQNNVNNTSSILHQYESQETIIQICVYCNGVRMPEQATSLRNQVRKIAEWVTSWFSYSLIEPFICFNCGREFSRFRRDNSYNV